MSESRRAPTFSFLTTAYQTESYLPETINSVISQSCPDWELIIVDNGYSDGIAAIVQPYLHDRRISLIRQENKGYGGGVMAAAKVARGDFLCVLDSDDQLMPNYVETIGEFVQSHPEVDAVGCDAYQFSHDEQMLVGKGYLSSIEVTPPPRPGVRLTVDDVLAGQVPYYGGAVHRRAWDAIGGYAPDRTDVEEDVLVWLRLATDFHLHLLPDRLTRSRLRSDSVSRSKEKVENFEERLIGTFELFARESGTPDHLEIVQATVRRLRYHQALRRARWAFTAGDVEGAGHHAREAYAQRHSVRAAAVVVAVTIAPGLLRTVYPTKQRLAFVARRVRQRFQP